MTAVEQALLRAVVAAAGDDVPRLVYADWLEENGDPDRAAFIRVQCRLADLSPAEPDWVTLTERQLDLAARLKPRQVALRAEVPEPLQAAEGILDEHEEPFRRGFPYLAHCWVDDDEGAPEGIAEFIAAVHRIAGEHHRRQPPGGIAGLAPALDRLVKTTTVRALELTIPATRLAEFLALPAAAELTGLALTLRDWEMEYDPGYRALAASPAVRRVRHLTLDDEWGVSRAGVAALARSRSLGAVRRLDVQWFDAPAAELTRLTKAPWFRRVRHFRSQSGVMGRAAAAPLVTGLGELPHLHTLELSEFPAQGVAALAAGRFPALARLVYEGPLGRPHAAKLAKAKFPRLVAFEAPDREAKDDALAALLRADWFARLRVLDLHQSAVTGKAVAALAVHPAAKSLRVLRLGDNDFGQSGLTAIGRAGAFPSLTTLDLRSHRKRRATPAHLAAFLSALHLPGLRHLDLDGWPLGNEGAKALAASPAFAGLTRLSLGNCQIGDPGAKALLESPHLQNLVELWLNHNAVRTGADALADPAVLPRLGVCGVSYNKIPVRSRERLRRRPNCDVAVS